MDVVRRVLPRGPVDFALQLRWRTGCASSTSSGTSAAPIVELRVQRWLLWSVSVWTCALAVLTLGALELACRR